MNRREARKQAFFLLFQCKFQPNETENLLTDFFEEHKVGKQESYIRSVVCGVTEKIEELDGVLDEYLRDWQVDRISSVSLTVMRLAIYEMLYVEDVPTVVSVNEAVALAKEYEGEEAAPFVNGILGEIKENV